MSLHVYLCELRMQGASIYIENGALRATSPPGVLTKVIRAFLRENRAAVMAAINRRDVVKGRLAAAYDEALRNKFLRMDVDPSEPAAELAFEEAVIRFIDGEAQLEAVSQAWKDLISLHKIPAQVSTHQYAAAI